MPEPKFSAANQSKKEDAQLAAREWRGRWWLPDDKEKAVGGELILSADEFVLTTDGPLKTADIPPGQTEFTDLFQRVVEPVIFGRARDGERLTLLDCEGAVPLIPADVNAGEWRPRSALVGAHLAGDELYFSAIDVELRHLAEWVGDLNIVHSMSYKFQNKRVSRVEVSTEQKMIGQAQIGDTKVELRLVPFFRTNDLTAEVGHYPRFRVEPAKPFVWQEALNTYVRPLRDLVTFATVRSASPEHMRLRPQDEGDDPGRLVELLLQLIDLKRSPETKRLSPYDVLFTASELPSGFETGLNRWFELHAKYYSVIGRVLSVYHAPFIYEDQRFLALAQAAEAYHGLVIGGTPEPKKTYKQKVAAAVAGIDDSELRAWAEPILADNNWYRLRGRLVQLLDAAGEVGDLISASDPNSFAKRVATARNDLTHPRKKKPVALDNLANLFWDGQAVAWLVTSLLLGQLGFAPDQVAQRVRRTPRFQGLIRHQEEAAE